MVVENSSSLMYGFFVFGAIFAAVFGFVCLVSGLVNGLSGKITVILGVFICIMSITPNFDKAFNSTEVVHDNPVNLSDYEAFISKLDNNVLNKEIAESIDADRATVRDRESLLEDLRNGEIVSFDAVGDGTDLSGKVYFTKSDMVVILNGDSEKIDKEIRVPTK